MQVVNWRDPLLSETAPTPRKGAAAAATEGLVVMFGGTGCTGDEQPVTLDELVLFSLGDNGTLSCRVNPSEVSGSKPAPRSGATLLEYAPGQLLLYGGVDVDGKPLDDAFLFDTPSLQWSKVYAGHPDLVGQEGAAAGHLSFPELRILACCIHNNIQ